MQTIIDTDQERHDPGTGQDFIARLAYCASRCPFQEILHGPLGLAWLRK